MEIKKLIRSLLLGSLCCLPATAVFAQNTPNYGTWGFDSNKQSTAQTAPATDPSDYQQIYSLLLTMADRWNAHDLNGFLNLFWNSPDLLVVIEGEQLKGWADFSASYRRGYTNPDDMGSLSPDRIQIQMVTPDVAVVLDWWTAQERRIKILGTTTATLRKFSDGWKIVVSHTSFVEP